MKTLSWIALIVGVLMFAGIAYGWGAVTRLGADAQEGGVSVWIRTPHVAPGGDVRMVVGVHGSLAVGIRSVRVTGGGESIRGTGRGHHWGHTIRRKANTEARDDVSLRVPLAADAVPGDPVTLAVQVEYVKAYRGPMGFSERSTTKTLQLPMMVRSAWGATALRAFEAAKALLLFWILSLVLSKAGRLLRLADEAPPGQDETENFAYVLVALAVLVSLAGYWTFVLPLMAATGLTGGGFVTCAMLVWIAGPSLLAWRRNRKRSAQGPEKPAPAGRETLSSEKRGAMLADMELFDFRFEDLFPRR